ncbi:Otopetrin [Homalodisca vitripennis]|nr:Otopetrin [Homalodisca vitripennis]
MEIMYHCPRRVKLQLTNVLLFETARNSMGIRVSVDSAARQHGDTDTFRLCSARICVNRCYLATPPVEPKLMIGTFKVCREGLFGMERLHTSLVRGLQTRLSKALIHRSGWTYEYNAAIGFDKATKAHIIKLVRCVVGTDMTFLARSIAGFFTYLYGVSILFLLYVFCFLLQESTCCQATEPKPKKPKKEKEKEKENKKNKKKEAADKKKEKEESAKGGGGGGEPQPPPAQQGKRNSRSNIFQNEVYPRKMKDLMRSKNALVDDIESNPNSNSGSKSELVVSGGRVM